MAVELELAGIELATLGSLSERPIFDYALKFCTYRLEKCTQGHKHFYVNQLDCNFDLCLNKFKYNLTKLFSLASL